MKKDDYAAIEADLIGILTEYAKDRDIERPILAELLRVIAGKLRVLDEIDRIEHLKLLQSLQGPRVPR